MREKLIQLRDFFLTRPKEDWCINRAISEDRTKCCMWGHTQSTKTNNRYMYIGDSFITSLFFEVDEHLCNKLRVTRCFGGDGAWYNGSPYSFLVHVNNGCYVEYQQPEIRDRVIAALEDGIKIWDMEHPEYKDITKDLAVLPVDEKVDVVSLTPQYESEAIG